MEEDKNALTWKAPEYVHFEKTANWYLGSIVIAAVLVVFAAFQKNLLFLAMVVVAEIAVVLLAKREPGEVQISILDDGIEAHYKDSVKEYPYSDLKGFAIYDNPLGGEYSELILRSNKTLSMYTKLLVRDEHAETVREVLHNYLDEIEYEEPLSDHIMKKIGF